MNIYRKLKGSSMEKIIQGQAQAELAGAGMYFTLARTARAHGLVDAADQFIELAKQHGEQASFYFSLVGRYPFEEKELWSFIKGLSKAEEGGERAMLGLAQKLEEAGFAEAAQTVKTFATEHKYHAAVTHTLVEKYAPEEVKKNNQKIYVCSICGYEYEGELDKESESYTCPICAMPKNVFKERK